MTIILSCILIAIIFAPLGCVILWHRYSYFGDGITHACLLASAIHLLTHIPIIPVTLLVALSFTAIVTYVQKYTNDKANSVNFVANGMTAFAIIMSILGGDKTNLRTLLIGDVTTVTTNDLVLLAIMSIITILVIYIKFRSIVLTSINDDIAQVYGINPKGTEMLLLMLTSITVAISMKIVGVILINAVLTIPATIARLFSKTPITMLIHSTIVGVCISIIGAVLYIYYQIPVSPLVTTVGFLAFFICLMLKKILI